MKTKLAILSIAAGLSANASAATIFSDSLFASPAGFQGGIMYNYGLWNNTQAPNSEWFLGQYGNQTATLALYGLPAHSSVTISFDFYAINSWDGDSGGGIGPDSFTFGVDGSDQFDETFAIFTGMTQSYPNPGNPGQSGADAINTLGFGPYGDQIYNLTFTVPHVNGNIIFDWEGHGLQSLPDESWGIDNIVVSIDGEAPVPEVHHYASMLGAALIATRALRRKA